MRKFVYLAAAMIFALSTSCAKPGDSKAVKPGIALTYANDHMVDGAGSQLLRVYGIYALSRYLHLPYVHTPLKVIDYQGVIALENNSRSADLPAQYNRVFTLPSDIELPENARSRFIDTPSIEDIERLKNDAENVHKFYLLRILLPFSITNSDPEMYRCLKEVSPFHATPSDIFRIAVHVRRGEEYVVDSQRMLPNSYYIGATMQIVEALKQLEIPFVCELYTELPSRPILVTGRSPGINGRLSKPRVIDPRMNRIEEFDVIPNLQKNINGDPIEALKGMTTADALIISRSTFSYLPALLGKGIVIYYPMGSRPLKEWLISDIHGNVPSAQLFEQLKSWKREHATAPAPAASH
jgi:hypothetical protein